MTRADNAAPASGERYVVLDLLRGLAALAVLLFHISYMLGSLSPSLDKGYLAVDFFFVLSGFVISANYHVTVRPAITWSTFLAARLARLWPLFILSTLLGAVVVVMKLSRDTGFFDGQGVFLTLAQNCLMLPSFLKIYGIDRLFIFNGASWSVFFEFVVNLVFFAVLRGLSLKPLLALSAVLAGLLLFIAQAHGSLDGGWSAATLQVGAARVLFGFTAGMATYALSRQMRFRVSGRLGVAVVLGLCLCLFLVFFASGNWLIECALVILGFPLLVFLASRCELAGLMALLGGRLGDISYSVYLLQTPVMLFVAGASQALIGRRIAEFAPLSGVTFVIGMLGLSYLSWRYFELPARDYLRARIRSRQERHALQS
jgi:peptidoglycan/LPS O-acetylase OafA/YrhL